MSGLDHLLDQLPFDASVVAALGVVVLVAAGGAVAHSLRRNGLGVAARTATRWLLGGTTLLILAITLDPGTGISGTNLRLLKTIRDQWGGGEVGMTNLVGNLAMFAVLGFFAVPALRWGAGRTATAALALSVAIELTQLRIGRGADVDDVLLNTIGGLIGALVAVALLWGLRVVRRARDGREICAEPSPAKCVARTACAGRVPSVEG